MSHHSSNVNGEDRSHKDPLSRILDELSSLKLWKKNQKEKIERENAEGENATTEETQEREENTHNSSIKRN